MPAYILLFSSFSVTTRARRFHRSPRLHRASRALESCPFRNDPAACGAHKKTLTELQPHTHDHHATTTTPRHLQPRIGAAHRQPPRKCLATQKSCVRRPPAPPAPHAHAQTTPVKKCQCQCQCANANANTIPKILIIKTKKATPTKTPPQRKKPGGRSSKYDHITVLRPPQLIMMHAPRRHAARRIATPCAVERSCNPLHKCNDLFVASLGASAIAALSFASSLPPWQGHHDAGVRTAIS